MAEWQVGILVDNLGLGIKGGIIKASDLGFDGIQVFVTSGEMHPSQMGKSARRDFSKTLAQLELKLSALCGDTGLGFFNPDTNEQQIKSAKLFLDLAVDLGTNIVTTHFGHPAEGQEEKGTAAAIESLQEIGRYAATQEVYFASETGSETPDELLAFLKKVSEPFLAVNYDPANLVMKGWDHLHGVVVLGPHIVHTHAKDADFKGGEMPLGEGDVGFSAYLAALTEAGYDGFLTVEREAGKDTVGDAGRALQFLKSIPRK